MAGRLEEQDLELVLQHTCDLWSEARQRHFFLTGGTGFFGCWLVETFCHINRSLQLDARLTILSRKPEAFQEKCPHLVEDSSVSLLRGDVRSFDFPQGTFDYVLHAATEASARQLRHEPLEMLTTIVSGTQRVLEFAEGHGCRRFLLTSSGAVYGAQPSEIMQLDETYPGAPSSIDAGQLYGEAKRLSELLCAVSRKRTELACVIARCWAFCGPHLPLNEHFAIGNFIRDALAGRTIEIHGDGTPRRSYLYAADLAIWLWTLLFRGPEVVPINVGSDQDLSIQEVAETVAAVLNPSCEVRVALPPPEATLPSRYVPSVARARDLLGLVQTVNLEQAILRTARWHQKQGARM